VLAKILFRPLGVFFGLFVARTVANKTFDSTWERRYGTEAPTWETKSATWPQVVGAAALRGTLMAVSAAVLSRGAAKGFYRLTGFWPGEEEPPAAPRLEPKRH
jgi:hypothetical protein